MPDAPPPGWYPDPDDPSLLRWWRGEEWDYGTDRYPADRGVGELLRTLTPGHPLVWRPAAPLRWIFPLIAAFVFVVGIVGAVQDPTTGRDLTTLVEFVMIVAVLVILHAKFAWRPRLELHVDRVVVRRTLDTRRISLRDIVSIDPNSAYGIRIRLEGGTTVQAAAVQKANIEIWRHMYAKADLIADTILAAKAAFEDRTALGPATR